MQTVNLGRHKFFKPQEHILFLNKIAEYYEKGSLKVIETSQSLSIYLEEGSMIYGTYSGRIWTNFLSTLQNLSPNISTLDSQTLQTVQTIYESQMDGSTIDNTDYLAICWLVNQGYISKLQTQKIVEELSLEVIAKFTKFTDAVYEFSLNTPIDDLPKFCHVSMSSLTSLYQHNNINSEKSYPYSLDHLSVAKSNSQRNINFSPQINKIIENKQRSNLGQELTNKIAHNSTKTEAPAETNPIYKVLCIDDSPTIIKAIKGFLDAQVFSVIGVEDPLKALMQILSSKPDVILLDISMPNLDGYELCSLLRKHPDFRDTPIIMVTGRTALIDRARAKLVRASGYLTKPFTRAELLKAVFKEVGYIGVRKAST
ncbi:response regulator [Calothrix sp. PCC 6303]|uniref:response regulator n=1 Tax=Calothrix sp. PCC 6303 TaxID=1170562 RepID=UPI0002A0220A|nr:response regulator [Calothrix sp. PCC 6303]AFZ03020.1 response regulator receiver protein [Calothrix sp. PCC 6303]